MGWRDIELGLPRKDVGFSIGDHKVSVEREWLQRTNLDQRSHRAPDHR